MIIIINIVKVLETGDAESNKKRYKTQFLRFEKTYRKYSEYIHIEKYSFNYKHRMQSQHFRSFVITEVTFFFFNLGDRLLV